MLKKHRIIAVFSIVPRDLGVTSSLYGTIVSDSLRRYWDFHVYSEQDVEKIMASWHRDRPLFKMRFDTQKGTDSVSYISYEKVLYFETIPELDEGGTYDMRRPNMMLRE